MLRFRPLLLALCVLPALSVLTAEPVEAQYFRFGFNKVQHHAADWHVVDSPHFEVLYDAERVPEAFARLTADWAEEAYGEVAALFAHRLSGRVPILVYPDHATFAVTNAAALPVYADGIGGVTERLKNRIALPFQGDHRTYRETLHHEIVHAVANDFFYGGSLTRVIGGGLSLRLPLWFNEGLAEFSALGWSVQADAAVRDALLNDRLPSIGRLGGLLAYHGGQIVFVYIEAQYGRQAITELLHATRALGSVEAAMQEVLGLSAGDVSAGWLRALREVHFPEATARESLPALGRPLDSSARRAFHGAVALSPQGDRVAYVSTRDGLFDVFVAPTGGEGEPVRLVEGQTTPAFESFPVLTPGLGWSPDGRRLAVIAQAGGAPSVVLIDEATRASRTIRLAMLDAVHAVDWSPDGTRLALGASSGGRSNIYLLNLASEALTNLTDDGFSNLEPVWTPDNAALVFHSDRGDRLMLGRYELGTPRASTFALYRLDLARPGRVERLAPPSGGNDQGASVALDGTVVFRSDRNGVENLYALDPATGRVRALTDTPVGFSRVSLSADGRRAAVIALSAGIPSTHLLQDLSDRDLGTLAPTVLGQRLGRNGTAPALAVAHPTTRADNPLLWSATQSPERSAPAEPPLARPPTEGERPPLASAVPEFIASNNATPEPADGRRYRLRFSPDLVYADLGYDTLFGVQSLVQAAISDLLGDHRIVLATNLGVDLRTADYLVRYESLGGRTNVALTGFHMARQLTDFERQAVFRYRNYGLGVTVSHPLDRFRRVEADLSLQGVSLADLVDPRLRARERVFLHPSGTYTVERVRPGEIGPGGGQRAAVRLSGSPALGGVTFLSVLADGRAYRPVGAATAALRLAVGASVGPQPQRYYSAGVGNWLNPDLDGATIRDENDFVFGTPVLPLRGFGFDAVSSSRFAAINAEVRMPLVAALLPGPLPALALYQLQGVAFADVAGFDAVESGSTPAALVESDTAVLLAGVGVGLRTLLLGYPVRADWAWPVERGGLGPSRFYVSIGLDF